MDSSAVETSLPCSRDDASARSTTTDIVKKLVKETCHTDHVMVPPATTSVCGPASGCGVQCTVQSSN